MSTAPEQTLYVGDSPIADVGGAHNAGLRTAWVRRKAKESNTDNRLDTPPPIKNKQLPPKATTADMMARLPNPDLTVESLSEIVELLSSFHAGQQD